MMPSTKRSIALGVREPFNGVFEAMDHDPPNAFLMEADVTVLHRGNAWRAADPVARIFGAVRLVDLPFEEPTRGGA
jgi:hypothetical protein